MARPIDPLMAESIRTQLADQTAYWQTICDLTNLDDLDDATAAQACSDVISALNGVVAEVRAVRRMALQGASLEALIATRLASQAVVDDYLKDAGREAMSLRNHAANECSE